MRPCFIASIRYAHLHLHLLGMIKDVIEAAQPLPNNPLAEVLAKSTIADVISTRKFLGKELVSASGEDTLETGVRLLVRGNMSSIPILSGDNKALGFVDLLDILKFVVVSAREATRESMQKEMPQLLNTKLQDLINFSHKDPLISPQFAGARAIDAAKVLAKGVHRVLVWNESKVFSVCSQADMVRYLSTYLEMKSAADPRAAMLAKETVLTTGAVSQLWDATRPVGVLSINASATVLQALNKLAMTGASGLAVIEEQSGKLVANFSVSDLKPFLRAEPKDLPHELLFEQVGEFLKKHSPASTKPVSAVLRADGPSLGSVIHLAAKTRVHRVWMVDEGFKPVGVSTLTNMLAAVTAYKQAASTRSAEASERKID